MIKFILSALLALAVMPAHAQGVIRISGQEGDERFIPLLTAIYKEMGLKAAFTILPSARALHATNMGDFDAEVGRIPSISPQYPNIIYTREPLLDIHLVAVAVGGKNITIQTKEDLRKYRVGYLNGMSVAESYVSKESISAYPVATHTQLAEMLRLGRLDVVLMGTAFKNSPVFNVGEIVGEMEGLSVYHIYNVRNKELVERFDQVLQRAKADGRYERLLAK